MIIGITGTLGAGKSTIVELLKKKGFKHYSARALINEEIKKRNMPLNRDSMIIVGNDLRKNHSPSYIAEQLYAMAKKSGGDSVIESLRTLGEIEALRKKGRFYLFAVDADPKIRYSRVIQRASESDKISYAKFLEDEKRSSSSNDPNGQNALACMQVADFNILNNSSLEDLSKKLEEIWNRIK